MESTHEILTGFEEWASPTLTSQQVPGLIVALAKDGKPIYTHGFGFSNVEQGLPIDEETIFGIGSVTKSFTALAVMQLLEAGKLSLSDPVIRYLPQYRTTNAEYTRATTIHHLLTHTSGLPMYNSEVLVATDTMTEKELKDIEPLIAQYGTIRDTNQLMEFIANSNFRFIGAPGERMSYSNDGYALLGSVIERVADMPYVDYIEQHIFEPAGLTRTTFRPEVLRRLDNVATLYTTQSGEEGRCSVPSPNWWHSSVHYPAGIFLNSCVRDMIRYLEIFRLGGLVDGARIVSPLSIQHILSRHVSIVQGQFYGYGMGICPEFFGQTLVEHGGGAKGVSSQVCILPEEGLTAVALSNLGGAPSAQILYGAIHTLQGRHPDSRMEPLVVNRGEQKCSSFNQYVGTYVNGDQVNRVESQNGTWMLEVMGLKMEIEPLQEGMVSVTLPNGRALTAQFFFSEGEDQPASGFNIGYRHYTRVS